MTSPVHQHWLRTEQIRLADFARRVVRSDNLGAWLSDDGNPDENQGGHTYITGRMAYVNYLAAMDGIPGARYRAEHLLKGLATTARDSRHGGWLERHDDDGHQDKSAYSHAFVILASATGVLAGDAAAAGVLHDALDVVDRRFWEEDEGAFADSCSGDWSAVRPYRGLNVNMHLVEAMLAATDATGDPEWARRARRVCQFVIELAATNSWRIPEHFDETWTPQLDYNRDRPDDPFKPFGATVGHAFEWSRLMVAAATTSDSHDQLVTGAQKLYARGVEDGWGRNGQDGFLYTTDWNGEPVVATRLHWVTTEAIGAAGTLAQVTDDPQYVDDYMRWWDYAERYLLDREHGSWTHELTECNEPKPGIWAGKPDLYHAYQATLVGQLPIASSFATAIATKRPAQQETGGARKQFELTTDAASRRNTSAEK